MGAAAAVVGDSGARLPAWEAATPVNKQRSHTRQARPGSRVCRSRKSLRKSGEGPLGGTAQAS